MISSINSIRVRLVEPNETSIHASGEKETTTTGHIEDREIQLSHLWEELLENGGWARPDRGYETMININNILDVYSYDAASDLMVKHPVVRVVRKFHTGPTIMVSIEQAGTIEMMVDQTMVGKSKHGLVKVKPEPGAMVYGYSAASLKVMTEMKIIDVEPQNYSGYIYSVDTMPHHNFMIDNVLMWDFGEK